MDSILELVGTGTLVARLVDLLPRAGSALLVLLVFFLVYRLTRRPTSAVLDRAGLDPKLVELLVRSLYRYTLLIVAVVMAASQVGINVTAAVAGLGVAGLAIGFAAQDALANIMSGVLIFWDKPFVIGDWITVEGEYGCVTDITLRSTRIRTPRNTYVVIPNKSIVDAVLVNHSKHGELRLDVPVGIAYREDVATARQVLLEAVAALEEVCAQPAPNVVVVTLGDSSVDLSVRVWIEDASREGPVFSQLLEACKRALDAARIQIPFPHRQLLLDGVDRSVWDGMARARA